MLPTGTRHISLTAEAERAVQYSYAFGWYQSETVVKRVQVKQNGVLVDAGDPSWNLEWVMTHHKDKDQVFFAQVGSVVGGQWMFQFDPSESTFAPGTYAGYLRLYKTEGDTLVQNLIVAREALTVRAAPGLEDVPVIGPITSTNYVRKPTTWPAGYLLASEDGGETTVAVPPGEGGGGGGGLETDDFEDTDSVTWEVVEGKLRAHVELPDSAGGTMLAKDGIDLTGKYNLGPGLTVVGDTIDAAVDTSDLLQVGGTPQAGKAPVYAATPYNAANWRHVAHFPNLPTTGEPLAVWWHPTNQEFFLAQPFAYAQAPSDPGDVQIGDGFALFGAVGEHAFVVPPGVTMLQVKGWGQAGGNNTLGNRGGQGGHVQGYLPVVPGETIRVLVAGHTQDMMYYQGGIGGGGNAIHNSAGGGGASLLWRGEEQWPDINISNLLAVAAGGGGANHAHGGNGGGLVGFSGSGQGGAGGSQTSGGSSSGMAGTSGGIYLRGGGVSSSSRAAGGGGLYGGGGGFYSGGGGSSYVGGLLFAITFAGTFSMDSDYQSGWAARSASTRAPGGQGGWVFRW